MKMPPCKDCPDRHLACHDNCDKYKEWKDYLTDTKTKLNLSKGSYRSKATDRKSRRNRTKYSANYMKNKY